MTAQTLQPTSRPDGGDVDAGRLRFGSAALAAGLLSQVPLAALHPHKEYANDSVAAFREYAHSHDWLVVHLGQYVGLLLVTLGLVTVAGQLARRRGAVGHLGLVAVVTAVVSAAVFAVQMAVDGVALKAAIESWQSATGTGDQEAAYQVAEAVRSVEKGLSALFNCTNGITLLSLGAGLILGRGCGRRLGWLAAVAGVGLLGVGAVTARTGFSHTASSLALPATVAVVVFAAGMAVVTWRRPAA